MTIFRMALERALVPVERHAGVLRVGRVDAHLIEYVDLSPFQLQSGERVFAQSVEAGPAWPAAEAFGFSMAMAASMASNAS